MASETCAVHGGRSCLEGQASNDVSNIENAEPPTCDTFCSGDVFGASTMDIALFTVLLVLCNVTATASISISDQTSKINRIPLPASRLVTFEQQHVRDSDRHALESANLNKASSAA